MSDLTRTMWKCFLESKEHIMEEVNPTIELKIFYSTLEVFELVDKCHMGGPLTYRKGSLHSNPLHKEEKLTKR